MVRVDILLVFMTLNPLLFKILSEFLSFVVLFLIFFVISYFLINNMPHSLLIGAILVD